MSIFQPKTQFASKTGIKLFFLAPFAVSSGPSTVALPAVPPVGAGPPAVRPGFPPAAFSAVCPGFLAAALSAVLALSAVPPAARLSAAAAFLGRAIAVADVNDCRGGNAIAA